MRPLKLSKNDEMPVDFWNYKVNPIVGFYLEPQHKNNEKKYGLTPITVQQ